MSKKNNDKKKQEFKIPEDAKRLIKLSPKKFKKESKGLYDSKKELKKAYCAQILDYMPETLAMLVRYGNVEEVKEVKDSIYEKITDPNFIKFASKLDEFDMLILLPIVVKDICAEAAKQVEAAKEDGQNITFDLTDLVELSSMILKKKVKKMKKEGIDEALAFDVLSVIPTPEVLKKSQYFHIRNLFTVIYEHAKDKEIPFEKIMKILFKGDEAYINSVITFALLERKEKIGNFTDSQKQVFNNITEYCFKSMEEMKKDDIHAILKAYTDARKRDESQGKDTNRRYYISSLPETDYKKILSVVTRMSEDESVKKYF